MAVDWAYLRSRGGENFEELLATLMRRSLQGLTRLNAGQGDGGVDLARKTEAGLEVWQCKVFTTPVTPSQRSQIRKSWETFKSQHVDAGVDVASYTLVTPWTPTAAKVSWFRELVGDVAFSTHWEGAAFLNGLAAAHPDVIALFEKGSGAFDSNVMAKAVIAGTPLAAVPSTMREAIADREAALRELRDQMDPNFLINQSERTAVVPGELPLPGPGEAGVVHRYKSLGSDRWLVESLVPRNEDSLRIDPITLSMKMKAEPGTPEAAALEDWRMWGIALKDFIGEVALDGGPFAHPAAKYRISLRQVDTHERRPGLTFTVLNDKGERVDAVHLDVTEVTRGQAGGGARLVAASFAGCVRLEIRMTSEDANPELQFDFPPTPGLRPSVVERELAWMAGFGPGATLLVELDNGARVAHLGDLVASTGALACLELARGLNALRPYSDEDLLMPDIRDVTDVELSDLSAMVAAYSGEPFMGTWCEGRIGVSDLEVLTTLNQAACMVLTEIPALSLGGIEYSLNTPLMSTIYTPRVHPDIDIETLRPECEVILVPGDDNRRILSLPPQPVD